MLKIINAGDSIQIEGIELSRKQLKKLLKEITVNRRKIEYLENKLIEIEGGVACE